MRPSLIALALASTTMFAQAAGTNLLTNGSFEATTLASGAYLISQSIPGWVAGTTYGIELRRSRSGSAYDGVNFAELDTTGNSSMSQSFSTIVGQAYDLSFAYAQRPDQLGLASNGMSWSAGNKSNVVFGQDTNTNWTVVNTSFVATATTTTLTFKALGTSDQYGTSLDAVSVMAQAAPVPEPEQYAMLLAGLMVVGFVARRRI